MFQARAGRLLRCIGARSRDVRRTFTTVGIAVALVGWLLSVPLGYALFRLIGLAGLGSRRRPRAGRVPAVEPPDRPPWDQTRQFTNLKRRAERSGS
jgi:ABC-type antimicrobial peptide transport system permease subunit